MNRLHIIGLKNSGKTTLMVDLTAELTRRGLIVGTIKHTSHTYDLDTPGKDSHRHRKAGASPAGIITPDTLGVFIPRLPGVDPYAGIGSLYASCNIILVEGDQESSAPKIEMWRAGTGAAPMAETGTGILAVVTDDEVEVSIPVWPRKDIRGVADRIIQLPTG